MLAEMEALSYQDMDQPITLANIDSEMGPREHTGSQITEATIALLRKSIEGKSLEKKVRRSDGSEDENRDRELDAKVREMKEKIEAAYQAEIRSPGKVTTEKDKKKTLLEKSEITDLIKKSPPELIPIHLRGDISLFIKEGKEELPNTFSGAVQRECLKRKSIDETIGVENEENGAIEAPSIVAEDDTMDIDQDQSVGSESQGGSQTEPDPPPKPLKPRPKTKAEIKRIKREKDRLRREAKKLAALEALKAPPPNPCEEDTRMSATDPNG